jgi:two-component system chemotaxis response regulator CheY
MAKILVVDDASVIRTWCNRVLTEHGHTVIEAIDGHEGVQRYQQDGPDGVLLDVTMPILNGLEALQQIRAFDPYARVAMLTVMGQKDVVIEARKLGARDFVLKPCEPARLLAAIERMLA